MLALILDRAHAFVDPVPDIAPVGDRPLVAVHAALPTIALPAPAAINVWNRLNVPTRQLIPAR